MFLHLNVKEYLKLISSQSYCTNVILNNQIHTVTENIFHVFLFLNYDVRQILTCTNILISKSENLHLENSVISIQIYLVVY